MAPQANGRRSDEDNDDRRRPVAVYDDGEELEQERGGEDVQKDGVLTLVVRGRLVEPEGDGRRRLSPLPRRSEAGGMRTATAVQGSTARFRRREERGGRGEAFFGLRFARGGSWRWRRAAVSGGRGGAHF